MKKRGIPARVFVYIFFILVMCLAIFFVNWRFTGHALWDWYYCSNTSPCSAGGGDCDADSECLTGYCAPNVGLHYNQSSRFIDVCECPTGTIWDGNRCASPSDTDDEDEEDEEDDETAALTMQIECVTGLLDEVKDAELKKKIFTSTTGDAYDFDDVFSFEILYSGVHGGPALTCRQDNGGWVLTGCNSAGADGHGNEQRMRDQNRCIGEYGGSAEVTTRCCRLVAVSQSSSEKSFVSSAFSQDRLAEPSYLMSATSSDGLIWKKNTAPVAEQARTPGALFDGTYLRVYFNRIGTPRVTFSRDGKTWQEQVVSVSGLPRGMVVLDQEVVLLPNGKYRMYYYEHPKAKGQPLSIPGDFTIALAISDDGINFRREGTAFVYERVMDPDVIKTGSVWRMFVSQDGRTIGAISHDDGKTFSFEKYLTRWRWISSTIEAASGYRMYYYTKENGKGKTYSAFSLNGGEWVEESGARIVAGEAGSLDENGPGSPAVLKTEDGTYWLFYTTTVG